MIKNFFSLLFLILIAILIGLSIAYNGDIIVNWLDYQLKTTTTVFFLSSILTIIVILLLSRIINIILSPNIKRRERKIKKNYNNHLKTLAEGFIYMILGDYKHSEKKQKESVKYIKNSILSDLLKAKILHKEKKYIESAKIFNTIKLPNIDTNFIAIKLKFHNARQKGDKVRIKKYAKQILLIKPYDEKAITELFKVYKNEKNWSKTEEYLNQAIKLKIFDETSHQRDIAFIYSCIARENFRKGNYKNTIKYAKQVYKILPNFLPANLLMSEAYLHLNKNKKAIATIRKSWKIKAHPKLGDLYMKIYKNKKDEAKFRIAKKLYKTNVNDFDSNMFLAKIAFESNSNLKARKYAKKALMLSPNKDIYKLLLNIENKENKNSSLAKSLTAKIKTAINGFGWKCDKCKKEHEEWYHECKDCNELDKIEWAD